MWITLKTEIKYLYIFKIVFIISLWPGDALWHDKTWSTVIQVMACCWQQQAITGINVDLSSVTPGGIHLKAISQEMVKIYFLDMSSKIIKNYSQISQGTMS